jgi:hypothetical protein
VAESDTRARLIEVLAAELEIRHGTVQTWGAHIADVVLALPEIATCVEDYKLAYRRGYEMACATNARTPARWWHW